MHAEIMHGRYDRDLAIDPRQQRPLRLRIETRIEVVRAILRQKGCAVYQRCDSDIQYRRYRTGSYQKSERPQPTNQGDNRHKQPCQQKQVGPHKNRSPQDKAAKAGIAEADILPKSQQAGKKAQQEGQGDVGVRDAFGVVQQRRLKGHQ